MITFNCKIKGVVDNHACYDCFNSPDQEKTAATRVLCKRENVTEHMDATSIQVNLAEIKEKQLQEETVQQPAEVLQEQKAG